MGERREMWLAVNYGHSSFGPKHRREQAAYEKMFAAWKEQMRGELVPPPRHLFPPSDDEDEAQMAGKFFQVLFDVA